MHQSSSSVCDRIPQQLQRLDGKSDHVAFPIRTTRLYFSEVRVFAIRDSQSYITPSYQPFSP